MAASEAICFRDLAQLGPFSFKRVRLFLNSSVFSLWRFASFLPVDLSIVGLPFSETNGAQS